MVMLTDGHAINRHDEIPAVGIETLNFRNCNSKFSCIMPSGVNVTR